MEMSFTLVMDREINIDEDCISPGGYEFTFPNGENIQFDFIAYYANVNKNNKVLLECEVEELDKVAFGRDTEARLIALFAQYETNEIEVAEFYVDTEENDPEIDALMVKDLIIVLEDKEYKFDDFEL